MGLRGYSAPKGERPKADYSELLRPYFVAASLALLFFALAYAGVLTFLPAYYKEMGLPQRAFGTYMMVVGIASFLMRVVGGKAADRRGPVPIITLGVSIVILGYIVLNVWMLPYRSYISAALIGTGFGLAVPAMQLMALGRLPQEIRSMGSSVYTMFFDLGMLGGQFSLGYLAELNGYAAVFPLLPFITGASLIIVHLPRSLGDGGDG
jgi:predicted MFS family arabinose efflux permease